MADDRPANTPADEPAETTGTAGTPADEPAETTGTAGTGAPGATPRTGSGGGSGSGSGRSWTWVLPALAFVAGVALGAAVVSVGNLGGDDSRAAAVAVSPSPSPDDDAGPSASADVVVRVPGACLEAADGAEEAAREVDDVADAVRSFDARRLQELVDRFQQLQPEVQRLADRCRELAGDRLQEGTFVTPEPVASTGPAPTPTP